MQSGAQIDAFRHEVKILKALAGRGTARLVAAGEDNEGAYVATEWSDFPALTGRRIEVDAIRAIVGALVSIAEASDQKGPFAIVHGDLSPANVLLANDGAHALVVDFGLACSRLYRPDPNAFRTFRGTLAYAAPEVARGEIPTHASDLFSLAAVIAHCLTGIPIRAHATGAPLLAEAGEKAPDLSGLSGEPNGAVVDVLRACLSFDPADRPRSAREVLERISVC